MPQVRILKTFRGFASGVFANIDGQDLKDGVADGAVDPKAKPADVPGAIIIEDKSEKKAP